jgi:hypothetical protein
VYNRGGIDLNQPGIGPTLASIRGGFAGPNGAGVIGGQQFGGRSSSMQSMAAGGGSQGPGAVPGNPIVVLTGLIGFAAILWLARKNSSYLQQNVIGFNTFNVVTIFVIAAVGFVLAKILFNKVPVPGVTPLVNAL